MGCFCREDVFTVWVPVKFAFARQRRKCFMAEGLPALKGDALVMTGTGKWSFLFSSEHSRRRWEFGGPNSSGSDVFHMTYDSMEGGQISFGGLGHRRAAFTRAFSA